MSVKLSILICSLKERMRSFNDLLMQIRKQMPNNLSAYSDGLFSIYNKDIQVLALIDDRELSIGAKRQKLLNLATGEYVAFIDDDDRIADTYIKDVMAGIAMKPDCCSLQGIITFDSQRPQTFIHSIDYDRYYEENGIFYRYPNHLNAIKREIAIQFPFKEMNHGEDTDFATRIHQSGLLKVEYKINHPIYYYDFITNKN